MDGVALSPERRREYHQLIAKLYLPYGVFVDSGRIVMQAVNYGLGRRLGCERLRLQYFATAGRRG